MFFGIVQVFVAAYKKQHLQDLANGDKGVYYNPPLKDDNALKMHLNKQHKDCDQTYICTLFGSLYLLL